MRSTFLSCAALLLTACGLAMSNADRLDRAEEALNSGDYRAAIIDAKDVLRAEPDNARGRVLLGRASAEIGDGASAEKELRRAIELGVDRGEILVPFARGLLQQGKLQEIVDEIQPDEANSPKDIVELKLVRGDAFMQLGQPAVARNLYNDVLTDEPDTVSAHLGLAASYRAEGNESEARRVLEQITSKYADDLRGWLAFADLRFASGNYEIAATDYGTAARIAENKSNIGAQVRALSGLAESHFVLGDTDKARDAVADVAELAPDSPQALFLTSRVAYLDEDWNTAQQNLQRILQLAPEYSPAQTLLGAVHLQTGNLSQAEMYLAGVVASTPGDDQARRLLAETRLQQRDAQEAEATLGPLISSAEPDAADLAMAARASLAQGDMDAAISFLQQSVMNDPGNTDLQFQLAIALMNAGRNEKFEEVLANIDGSASRQDEFRRDMLGALSTARSGGLDAALLAARELAEDWPRNPNAYNLLGSVLAARADLDGARASFTTAVELQPGDLVAQRSLASIDEQQGDLEAAKSRYSMLVEAQPNAVWAMFHLARLAARDNNIPESLDWLQRIRRTDENAVQPRASLAAILLAQGDAREAEEVIEEALRVDSEIAELHNLLGRARTATDDHAGASAAFKDALELAPDNDQYRLNLANAQRQAGNGGLAEQTLLENGSVNLDHIPSAVTAASLKVDSGDLDGALQIARALQGRHPASPIPLALEGEIQARSGRLGEANDAYDRALQIGVLQTHALRAHRIKTELGRADRDEPLRAWLKKEPQDDGVRMVLAESLQRTNKLGESIDEYHAVIEQSPDNGVALNNLAWTYHMADDGRAAETARRAYSLLPENGAVADTLGWILVETGDVEEGVGILKQAVELSNGRAEVRYHYASGLAKSGKSNEARRILQDVLSSDDDFSSREDAERLLADL